MDRRKLAADLLASIRWITTNTYCALQSREGWYVDDCIERKAKTKCERCKILARLRRQHNIATSVNA